MCGAHVAEATIDLFYAVRYDRMDRDEAPASSTILDGALSMDKFDHYTLPG